jgi:hypothetical protein
MDEETLRYAKGHRKLLKLRVLQIRVQPFHPVQTEYSGQYSDWTLVDRGILSSTPGRGEIFFFFLLTSDRIWHQLYSLHND